MVKYCSKTNDEAGDGTTTAISFQAIAGVEVASTLQLGEPNGCKRGIDAAVEHVKEKLISSAKKVKDSDEIAQLEQFLQQTKKWKYDC